MSFVMFFAVLGGLFLISMVGYRVVFHLTHAKTAIQTGNVSVVLSATMALPLVLWGGALIIPTVWWQAPLGTVLTAVVCAGAWGIVQMRELPIKTRALVLFGLSFAAAWGITVPPDSFLGSVSPVVVHAFMAVVATVFIGMFVWLDRIPGFNVNATAGFLLLMTVMGAFFHKIPSWTVAAAAFLWILAVPLNVFVGIHGPARCIFGIVGFLWGFLLMVLTVYGLTGAGFVTAGYYVFEVVFVVLFTAITARRLAMLSDSFLTEQAMQAYPNDPKLSRFIMMRSLLFGAIGIVFAVTSFQTGVLVYTVCLGIMCVDLYRRLADWGAPKVRLRDLFSDMKNGVRALVQEAGRLPLKQRASKGAVKSVVLKKKSPANKPTSAARKAPKAPAKTRQKMPKKRTKRA